MGEQGEEGSKLGGWGWGSFCGFWACTTCVSASGSRTLWVSHYCRAARAP